MQISEVNFFNLDELYEIVVNNMNNSMKQYGKFMMNFHQLLNRVSINFSIKELSQYEYVFLKLYSSSISTPTFKPASDEYIESNYSDLKDSVKQVKTLLESINEDNSLEAPISSGFYLPSGLITTDCVVSFTGSQLIKFVTLEPIKFFMKMSNNKCIVNEKPNFSYGKILYSDEDFKNNIISLFLNSFYKFMHEKATYVDKLSDEPLYDLFKKYNKEVSPLSIRGTNILFDFSTDDISTFKSRCDIVKNSKNENMLNDTKIEFVINTEFAIFVELLSILPLEKFTAFLPFSICQINKSPVPECPEAIKDKFSNRFKGRLDILKTNIENYYSTSVNTKLKYLELTESYQIYSFILTLDFSDIDRYFNSYVSENNLRCKTDYTAYRTRQLIQRIISIVLSFYNAMK